MREMRLNGIQEVSGSIPLISTTEESPETLEKQVLPGFFCCLFSFAKSAEKI